MTARNMSGKLVESGWHGLPKHFAHVELDAFVVMPNHVHGIIIIGDEGRGEATANVFRRLTHKPSAVASPLQATAHGTQARSLGAIVQNFKAMSTRRINAMRRTTGIPVWQRNYYEHIIRDKRQLHHIRQYIANNPLQWALDQGNPARKKA